MGTKGARYMPEAKLKALLIEVALNYGQDGANMDALAKKYSVNVRKLSGYASGLRAAGIDIPRYRRGNVYLQVYQEFKERYPDRIIRKSR